MTRMSIDDRRRELIAAAVRVISRDGVAAASTRAISSEASMPLASFHYAFESRDELLRAVIIDVTSLEHDEAASTVFPTDDIPDCAPDELIRRSLEAYVDSLVANPGREQALLELSLSSMRNDSLKHLPAEQYQTYYQAAENTLRVWEERGALSWATPIPELAKILITVIDGITTNWLATRDTAAAKATLPAFATLLANFAGPHDVSTPSTPPALSEPKA